MEALLHRLIMEDCLRNTNATEGQKREILSGVTSPKVHRFYKRPEELVFKMLNVDSLFTVGVAAHFVMDWFYKSEWYGNFILDDEILASYMEFRGTSWFKRDVRVMLLGVGKNDELEDLIKKNLEVFKTLSKTHEQQLVFSVAVTRAILVQEGIF